MFMRKRRALGFRCMHMRAPMCVCVCVCARAQRDIHIHLFLPYWLNKVGHIWATRATLTCETKQE